MFRLQQTGSTSNSEALGPFSEVYLNPEYLERFCSGVDAEFQAFGEQAERPSKRSIVWFGLPQNDAAARDGALCLGQFGSRDQDDVFSRINETAAGQRELFGVDQP